MLLLSDFCFGAFSVLVGLLFVVAAVRRFVSNVLAPGRPVRWLNDDVSIEPRSCRFLAAGSAGGSFESIGLVTRFESAPREIRRARVGFDPSGGFSLAAPAGDALGAGVALGGLGAAFATADRAGCFGGCFASV